MAAQSSTTVSSGSAVPVGLFGDGSNTTLGCTSFTSATARAVSRVKSSSRRPATQPVWVSRAYSGYIEYVGANDTTVRPGPPKAWSRWSITSFDPLAAHTCAGSVPRPPSVSRYAASPARSAANSRSGYRLSDLAAPATAAATSATTASEGG